MMTAKKRPQSLADTPAIIWMLLMILPKGPEAQMTASPDLSTSKIPCSSLPSLPHSGSVKIETPPRQSSLGGPSSSGNASSSSSPKAGSSSPGELPAALNCSLSDRLVAVRIRMHAKRGTATAGIFLCPSVKMLLLQSSGHEGHFLHVPLQVRVTSCVGDNDTWVLMKGRHRSHVMLRLAVEAPVSSDQELNYFYSIHDDDRENRTTARKSVYQGNKNRWDDRHSVERAVRWKRSAKNPSATGNPLPNGTFVLDGTSNVGLTSGCGDTKTCIRYGWEGCGHLTCDYMLSYRVLDNTVVDIEMSAKGPGWVAVGFSSDKFMGGDDDVVGCKQKRKLSAEVVSMSLGNRVKHTRPQEKANRLELLTGLLHNQHIYCRVRRPLKYKERLANSDLDLVNDWHQLYAFGDIDSTGRILQHTELPRVSEQKISMIRVTDIMVVISAAAPLPFPTSCLLAMSLSLVFGFAGS